MSNTSFKLFDSAPLEKCKFLAKPRPFSPDTVFGSKISQIKTL